MKITTISKALLLALLATSFYSCKGGLIDPEETKDPNVPVKMVHTYEIITEQPVKLIWNVSSMLPDGKAGEIFLNGHSIGKGFSPLSLPTDPDQPIVEGKTTWEFETTSIFFYSSFQIDWDYSEGKQLSYKLTATRDGKVVFEDEVSFPNEKQPKNTGIGFSNTYVTATLKNIEEMNVFK